MGSARSVLMAVPGGAALNPEKNGPDHILSDMTRAPRSPPRPHRVTLDPINRCGTAIQLRPPGTGSRPPSTRQAVRNDAQLRTECRSQLSAPFHPPDHRPSPNSYPTARSILHSPFSILFILSKSQSPLLRIMTIHRVDDPPSANRTTVRAQFGRKIVPRLTQTSRRTDGYRR